MYSKADQIDKNCSILTKYIHPHAAKIIAQWIIALDFKLKIKKERVTRFGDYRPPQGHRNHIITINQNLNPHAFLITLIHEIAHLKVHLEFGPKLMPHGIEWKRCFSKLLNDFTAIDVFPPDVLFALNAYIKNPAASSCSDLQLYKVLFMYNTDSKMHLLDLLPEGTMFYTKNRRAFIKGKKQRTRYRCKENNSSKTYLFPAACEVYIS
jgi:SprT protein